MLQCESRGQRRPRVVCPVSTPFPTHIAAPAQSISTLYCKTRQFLTVKGCIQQIQAQTEGEKTCLPLPRVFAPILRPRFCNYHNLATVIHIWIIDCSHDISNMSAVSNDNTIMKDLGTDTTVSVTGLRLCHMYRFCHSCCLKLCKLLRYLL